MKRSYKYLCLLLTSLIISSCSSIDRINLRKLVWKNSEIIEESCKYRDFFLNGQDMEFYVMIYNHLFMPPSYDKYNKNIDEYVDFKNEVSIFLGETEYRKPLIYEMKNYEDAKYIYNKYLSTSFKESVKLTDNIVYTDGCFENMLLGNYYQDDDNILTLDGKSLLTKLSNEEILYLPDVKEIKLEAFSYYTLLKQVYMPQNLEIIGHGSFSECRSLEKIHFNNSIKEIRGNAFFNCVSLKDVVIPSSVENIEYFAFTHGNIYCEVEEQPSGWEKNFAGWQSKVYWKNQWKYDENGNPVLI